MLVAGDARHRPSGRRGRAGRGRSRGRHGDRAPLLARRRSRRPAVPPGRRRRGTRSRAPRPRDESAGRHARAAGVHPDRCRARLVDRAHADPGRRGRHALPRRLRGCRAVTARRHGARAHPPGARRAPRRHRRPAGGARPRPAQRPAARHRPPPRVVDHSRDRPGDRRGHAQRDRGDAAPSSARRRRRGGGLPEDAPAGPGRGRRRAEHVLAGQRRGGDRRRGAAALAGRRPLHVPRLPRVPPRHRGRPGRAAAGDGHRAGHPARRRPGVGRVRQASAGGTRQGAREAPARADQGQLALHGAPRGTHGLRRREGVRRRRGGRRAPVPRPAVVLCLLRERAAGAAAAREGPPGDGRGRLRPGQPQRQRPAARAGDLPPRRAVPDARGVLGLGRPFGGRPARPRTASALRPPGRLRAVPVVPGVPAPRPVQHRRPPGRAEGADRGHRGGVDRLHRPGRRVVARSAARGDRHARRAVAARPRPGCVAEPDRRGDPRLGRRVRRGSRRGGGGGARREPGPPLPRRLLRRLPRRLLPARRRDRRPGAGGAGRALRPVGHALPPAGTGPGRAPVQDLPHRPGAGTDAGAADPDRSRCRRRRRVAVRHRAR